MKNRSETPFDSVEGAHEYLSLLSDAIQDARGEIEADIRAAEDPKFSRRLEALRLVSFKLDKLEQHVRSGRRLLNDLRTLRRLLLDEREEPAPKKT
ncbi:MAG TPA: hypothetical protein VIW67_09980 [Terriglobales bacterium]|jgi:hypothetical protein